MFFIIPLLMSPLALLSLLSSFKIPSFSPMAHLLSPLHQHHDSILHDLRVQLASPHVSDADLFLIDKKKADITNNLLSLQNQKTQMMVGLEEKLKEMEQQLFGLLSKRREWLNDREAIVREIESDELQAKNFGVIIAQKEHKLALLKRENDLLMSERVVLSRDLGCLKEENSRMHLENQDTFHETEGLLKQLEDISGKLASQKRLAVKELEAEAVSKAELTKTLQQLGLLSKEVGKVETESGVMGVRLLAVEKQNKQLEKELAQQDEVDQSLSQQISILNQKLSFEKTKDMQIKDRVHQLQKTISSKNALFSNNTAINASLTRTEAELRAKLSQKELHLKELGLALDRLTRINRQLSIQVETMRADDLIITNILSSKFQQDSPCSSKLSQPSSKNNTLCTTQSTFFHN